MLLLSSMVNVGIGVAPWTGGLSRAVLPFITPKPDSSKPFLTASASLICLAVSACGASGPDLSSCGPGDVFTGTTTRASSSGNGRRGGLEDLLAVGAVGAVGGALASGARFLARISSISLTGMSIRISLALLAGSHVQLVGAVGPFRPFPRGITIRARHTRRNGR